MLGRIFAGIGLAVTLAAVIVWFNWPEDTGQVITAEPDATESAGTDRQSQWFNLPWEQEEAASGETGQPAPAKRDDDIIWQELPRNANVPPVTHFDHEEYPDAVLLDITNLRNANWYEGKEVTFRIPQTGYILTTQVEEMTEPYPGIRVLKSYPDETFANHMLVTIGQRNTFASIFTPDGEFEVKGNDRHGWIVPSSSLPGPTEDDYIVMPPPGVEEPRRPGQPDNQPPQ